MKSRLRTRLAMSVMTAMALFTLLLFAVIYLVVERTVYSHLDGDLASESIEVLRGIVILSNEMVFANPAEWSEREHGQVEINPVFVQVSDAGGKVLRQSANLRGSSLPIDPGRPDPPGATVQFGGSAVRIRQTPLLSPQGNALGFLVVAIPAQEAEVVLANLQLVLILGFPLALLALFLITRAIIGKGTAPIESITAAAETISPRSIDSRLPLPGHDDEVRRLAITINDLLARLQEALLRERQFVADASHELRTPIASLRGTLDVLLRRPRSPEHYEEKIRFALGEADRLSGLVDQLLHLARCESGASKPALKAFDLREAVQEALEQAAVRFPGDERTGTVRSTGNTVVRADRSFTGVILGNILSNARKYSPAGSSLDVRIDGGDGRVRCTIADQGSGIAPEHLPRIFERFYRADASRNSAVEGTGLGLTIVKRLADLQGLHLEIDSQPASGTRFTVVFPADGSAG